MNKLHSTAKSLRKIVKFKNSDPLRQKRRNWIIGPKLGNIETQNVLKLKSKSIGESIVANDNLGDITILFLRVYCYDLYHAIKKNKNGKSPSDLDVFKSFIFPAVAKKRSGFKPNVKENIKKLAKLSFENENIINAINCIMDYAAVRLIQF